MRSLREKHRFNATSILFRVTRGDGGSSLMEGTTDLLDKARNGDLQLR